MKLANEKPNLPGYYYKKDGAWVAQTFKGYADEVRACAKSLIAHGFQPGHTVTVLGFNRPEWVIADLAAMTAGGAPAGIYTTCSPPEVQYIIHHAEARFVFLENLMQWKKVEQELANLPNLHLAVMMKGAPAIDHPKVMSWEKWMAEGKGVSDADLDRRLSSIKATDLATMIYTSGTTGPPKGVMLSAENLSWTAGQIAELFPLGEQDSSLSYLPLAHIAEQMFSIHGPITYGWPVYFAESLEKLPDNLKEVQPTVFFGVPRIWEKLNAGIASKLALATGVKKSLAEWAMGVGREHSQYVMRGESVPFGLGLQYKLANKLIFSKVKAAIGLSRARVCVSGAAPISKEVLSFFTSLDVIVLEVYGQSEDCGPTSFNKPGDVRLGSVGKPFPGDEVRIADDGEIMIRGKNVFLGYYKDDKATAETLVDGWLASGDLGSFDSDGYLHITGRKKEIIITSGGKNIAPKNIEAAIKDSPLVTEAVVIGDRRKFISALICLDPDAAKKFAEDNGIDVAKVHEDPKTIAAMQEHINKVNEQFARVEWVRKFTILEKPLSIEAGELTATLKVKRKVVNERYSREIEAMYADGNGID